MPKEEDFISITVTLKKEDIEYLEKVMAENDQNRSQVIRALIRNHKAQKESKKGAK